MEPIPIDRPVKLATPIPGFTYFAEDQVLTADQLNRLIQYLDFEQRASRAWLTGSGIICGLEISAPASGRSLQLSAGCALTSDGDLLAHAEARSFTHIRPFEDKDAKYGFFAASGPLRELITAADRASGDRSTPLAAGALNGAVLALYLESHVKAPDFCTTESCDSQGKIQHLTPRLLALPVSKIDALQGSLTESAVSIPVPASTRPKIQLGTISKLEGAGGLQGRFTTAIATTRNSIIDAAKEIRKQAPALAAVLDGDRLDWLDKLPAAPDPKNEVARLQDIHAFYRDFCEAFGEWRESLFACSGECAPNIPAHPKHVLLGSLAGEAGYRHPFRRAAALAGCGAGLLRSRLLWQRLRAMTEAFITTRASNNNLDKIALVPSETCDAPLGRRALPAYYGPRFSGPWNIESVLRGDTVPPHSYFNTSDARLDAHGCRESLYRIEGHIGKPVDGVRKSLEALRQKHNLAFQILAIQIEDDPAFAIPRPHRFFDLETEFYKQRTKFKLQLRDVADFAGSLQSAIVSGRERIPTVARDGIPAPDVAATTDAAGQVRAQSRTALNAMPLQLKQMTGVNSANFVSAYTETISQSHIINKNIGTISGQVGVNPVDRMVQPENSANWKILIDRLNKRTKKIAELSTFEKFVSANPGLEHLGGVTRGGTFVLVYSASEKEAERIVKADFSLPYFSYFDLNSLDEEETPAEPEEVIPQFPFTPPKWKDIYTWNISPVTEVAVGKLFDAKGAQLATAFDHSLTLEVNKQFNAFTNLVPLFQTRDLPKTGITGGQTVLQDAALMELQNSIARLAAERDDLVRKTQLGIAPADVGKQIESLEKEISINTGRGLDLIVKEANAAVTENRPVGSDYQVFTRTLADSAYTMQSNAGRKELGKVYDNATSANAGNAFIAGNVGRIGAMLKVGR